MSGRAASEVNKAALMRGDLMISNDKTALGEEMV